MMEEVEAERSPDLIFVVPLKGEVWREDDSWRSVS